MSRTSFSRRFSFTSGRKNSREGRHPPSSSHHHPGDSLHHSHHHHHHHHNSLQDKRQHSRRENPDAEKVARGIFGDVPLTDTERRFLSAAETGHLVALEQCVEENGNLNLTCRDYLGRTALQLAVLGEHFDCIQYLLEKSSLDVIEEALLHAIKTENVKICDMFLSHPLYSDKGARMQLEFQHGFYDQEDNSSSFAPDITPVVLAAQCNNFDIVHMLIQKGFMIQRPHHYFCYCTECSNHKTFDRFVHSRSRLNAYRGLASTAYLSLSCDDPILTAFELSKSLQNLAETEKEYKNEYRTLSESCKSYAVDLLDLCRSNEEVMAALHGGSDTRDLSRIKMAIRYEQKKFIAHASCQEHLMSMWYSGVPWFQHQPFTMKLFLLPLGIMFIPVTAIIYVFLPYSRVGEVLRSPFMKFVNYICSYTSFLVLLFFATTLTSSTHTTDLFSGTEGVVNSLIMFYVLGMFWAECKQLWEMGVKGYFSQMWNYMDITMLALYTAAYAIEAVIYTKVVFLQRKINPRQPSIISMGSDETGIPDPQILSRVLFSVANVMSFARIAYILPASETFGQLQISYGRMLQDVGKFIFIYFTVMIAFICGLTSLYSLSDNAYFTNLLQTTGTLFWAAFGMGYSAAPEIEGGTSGRDRMVEMVGYILYSVYILGAVVVLINMLIAMMSNTFEEIQECEDIEWKFARAKLWISFIEEGTTLPIPFNIVPTPKSILKICYYIKTFFTDCTKDFDDTDDRDGGFSIDYKAIMHKVVLRYIHKMKFEKKGDNLKEDLLDAKEEILTQTYNMCSALHSRIDSLERHLSAVSRDLSFKDQNSFTHTMPAPSPTSPTPTAVTTTASGTTTTTSTTSGGHIAPSQQPMEVRISTCTPSTSPAPHRPLHAALSMPVQRTDSPRQRGRLTASFYEPKREFVSRRWSYYSHDRPRRTDRQWVEYQQVPQTIDQQDQQRQRPRRPQQQQQQQQPQQDHPGPSRDQQERHIRLQRQQGRADYSPVRYEDRGDYSPVRYEDTSDHSPVRYQDRGRDVSRGEERSRDRRRDPGRQASVQHSPTRAVPRSPSQSRSPQRPTSSQSQRGDLSPQSPRSPQSPSHPLSPSQDAPILRPDLTPTRSQGLRREFSRTERHLTRSSPGAGRGSRSPSSGGGMRSITPRASPSNSPAQPRQDCQEMEMTASERHSRTQSLHRDAHRAQSSRLPSIPSQRSKEV